MRCLTFAGIALLAAHSAFAQPADPSLTFEVASVRVHPPVPGESSSSTQVGGPGTNDPGRITATNRPLRSLIIQAYGIRNFQIEHPVWVGEDRFDMIAKVPPGTTKEQARSMMQNLLAERFHLQIRREKRDIAVYVLAAADRGANLKPSVTSEGSSPAPSIARDYAGTRPGEVKVICRQEPMPAIVTWFTNELLDRPVIDSTGLQGNYDFDLTLAATSGTAADNASDIIHEIQRQLGLRVQARKLPMDVIVVESALRVPVAN